jgi:hypothetical protein
MRIVGYEAVLHSRVCIAQAFEAGSRYPAGAISIRMETRYLPTLAPVTWSGVPIHERKIPVPRIGHVRTHAASFLGRDVLNSAPVSDRFEKSRMTPSVPPDMPLSEP